MERFNMGRYYPPDAENAPRFNTSRPTQGTVRFELPFAVWCNTCKPAAIIGQGVRFNAVKKKVGNYYSTSIWSFRMKHTACGGWWEIRTDPKTAEYIVVEGASRRDYGEEEKGGEGDFKFLTEEEKEKRRTDAFANLEGRIEEKGIEIGNKERVEELYERAEVWRDPYEVNAKLRKDFRVQRKVLKKEERFKEGMQDKFSLGIDIVKATEADAVRAKMVEFGAAETTDGLVEEAVRRPLFATKDEHAIIKKRPTAKKLKSEVKAEKSRHGLQQTLVGNTRASIDPFLAVDAKSTPKMNLGILKRKRGASPALGTRASVPQRMPIPEHSPEETPLQKSLPSMALVEYDSD
ncbi:DUF572-domain-containing protein [Lentithecium fluviatile CBS 122367]|uniref:DUF572-domain-containing protein n=1 Tax=Lentithecium fluviatile CBS 122367 TaxID=1168545 RepID=A0A6G1IRK4_9PLEO|nr:DUF572-domain-containing protein [Lentithecium fluviatile CBS 122367]